MLITHSYSSFYENACHLRIRCSSFSLLLTSFKPAGNRLLPVKSIQLFWHSFPLSALDVSFLKWFLSETFYPFFYISKTFLFSWGKILRKDFRRKFIGRLHLFFWKIIQVIEKILLKRYCFLKIALGTIFVLYWMLILPPKLMTDYKLLY